MDRKRAAVRRRRLWRFWNTRFDDVDKKQRGITHWHVCPGPCISVNTVSRGARVSYTLCMDRKHTGVCHPKMQHSWNTRADLVVDHDPRLERWRMWSVACIHVGVVPRGAPVSLDSVRIAEPVVSSG